MPNSLKSKINSKRRLKTVLRFLEAGARNSAPDMKRIQGIHDMVCELGAACSGDNVPGVTQMSEAWRGASPKGKRCVSKLMAQGHSESSAIAICRASLSESIDKGKARRILKHLRESQ